jgi:CRP/FNR family transcriptional regulator
VGLDLARWTKGIHSYKLEWRLSNFLLLHASADGIVRMTHQEIASHLGTTREVVARALGQLASAKRIRTGRRQIVIDDPARLAEDVRRRKRESPKTTR